MLRTPEFASTPHPTTDGSCCPNAVCLLTDGMCRTTQLLLSLTFLMHLTSPSADPPTVRLRPLKTLPPSLHSTDRNLLPTTGLPTDGNRLSLSLLHPPTVGPKIPAASCLPTVGSVLPDAMPPTVRNNSAALRGATPTAPLPPPTVCPHLPPTVGPERLTYTCTASQPTVTFVPTQAPMPPPTVGQATCDLKHKSAPPRSHRR